MKLRLLLWASFLSAVSVATLSSVPRFVPDDPVTTAMMVVRLLAGVLAVYLLAATFISVVAAVGWRRSVGPAVVRRLLVE